MPAMGSASTGNGASIPPTIKDAPETDSSQAEDIYPGDIFCERGMCKIVRDYQVPDSKMLNLTGQSLQKHFTEYLHHKAGKIWHVLGTYNDIEARSCCPLCRFVSNAIKRDEIYPYRSWPESGSHMFVRSRKSKSIPHMLELGASNSPDDQEHVQSRMSYHGKIILITDSIQPSAKCGRALKPGGIDINVVKRWVRLCEDLHTGICPPLRVLQFPSSDTHRMLRVVDVVRECITDIAWTQRYAALSYIWGDVEQVRLSKEHLTAFSRPGALSITQARLPRTIRDAMAFLRSIEIDYLWVDALCLVQDDEDDMTSGIAKMHIIYERAFLTLIAATGRDADAGLPGVGDHPRGKGPVSQVLKPGLELLKFHPLDEYLEVSTWNSRGWTLQEHYLSRRTLLFVNGQVYWRCRERTWCEELWDNLEPEALLDSQAWSMKLSFYAQQAMDKQEAVNGEGHNDIEWVHTYLHNVIRLFQSRTIRYDNDVLNAMAGLLQRVSLWADTMMIQGLPKKAFPQALCFRQDLRDAFPRDWPVRRTQLPSWSWAGWRAYQVWTDTLEETACYRTSKHLYVSNVVTPSIALIRIADADTSNKLSDICSITWLPNRSYQEKLSIPQPGARFDQLSDVQRKYQSPHRSMRSLVVTAVFLVVRLGEAAWRGVGTDIARAHSVLLELHTDLEIGRIYPDVELETSEGIMHTILLLAPCLEIQSGPYETAEPKAGSGAIFDVMLVVPVDDGVYERRGIGTLDDNCINLFSKMRPRWRTILLQ